MIGTMEVLITYQRLQPLGTAQRSRHLAQTKKNRLSPDRDPAGLKGLLRYYIVGIPLIHFSVYPHRGGAKTVQMKCHARWWVWHVIFCVRVWFWRGGGRMQMPKLRRQTEIGLQTVVDAPLGSSWGLSLTT